MPSQVAKPNEPAPNSVNLAESTAQEGWLDLPGGRMRYLKAEPPPGVADPQPPLILIHGLMGYAFSWRFTIPTLARSRTVYAIDNLGAGLSSLVAETDCRLQATADRVIAFVDAMGISSFDLLGTSHGGGVAILTAALCAERRDERLKRLILVAPINPWSPHGRKLAPFLGRPLGSFLFRHTIERWRWFDYLWLRRLFSSGAKIPPDSLEGYRIPVRKNRAFVYGRAVISTWTEDLHHVEVALPKIRDYPTLLVWGSRDRAVAPSSAERLARHFLNCRVVIFDNVGHLPYEESPAEFNRALIEFLS